MATLIKLYLSTVWTFLRPFALMLMSRAGQALAAAALRAVTIVAETYGDADGESKRQAAFEMIVDDLRRRGVAIGTEVTASMINAALETAVQKIKADA